MKKAQFDLHEYTPAEMEGMTGLTTGMQRDWRHRKYISSAEGHARFDILDLAGVFAMKTLADRGIGPQRSFEVQRILSEVIAWHALGFERAYEGDFDSAFEITSGPAPKSDPNALKVVAEIAKRNPALGLPQDEKSDIEQKKADLLRTRLFSSLGKRVSLYPKVRPGHIFIWWPVGEPVWVLSYDDARAQLQPDDPRLHGPAIVFDLAAAGRELLRRAGGPVVTVMIE